MDWAVLVQAILTPNTLEEVFWENYLGGNFVDFKC